MGFSCQEAKAARRASSKCANKSAGRRAAATNSKALDKVSAAQPLVEAAISEGWWRLALNHPHRVFSDPLNSSFN